MAMKSLTCSFHLQELGREQDPEVPAQSDGQEKVWIYRLWFHLYFLMNAWRKSRFFALCTQLYSTGSPLAQGRCKGLSWRDLIPTNAWGSGTSLAT